MFGTPLRSLRNFQKMCGKKMASQVILVTTMWDQVDEEIGDERLAELERTYWKAMISRGAVSFKYENSSESAKTLLRDLAEKKMMQDQSLQLSVLTQELRETDAGEGLSSRLGQLAERRLEILQRLRTKREMGESDARTAEDLRREYNELKVQLDATLDQVKVLTLSRKQRILTAFRKAFSYESCAYLLSSSPPS
ncbi:hypothetical protein ID866_8291 [Astraeus odoratus]|nr:hypothetical protein ID866_8291 [Astraeus odoratus]